MIRRYMHTGHPRKILVTEADMFLTCFTSFEIISRKRKMPFVEPDLQIMINDEWKLSVSLWVALQQYKNMTHEILDGNRNRRQTDFASQFVFYTPIGYYVMNCVYMDNNCCTVANRVLEMTKRATRNQRIIYHVKIENISSHLYIIVRCRFLL